HGCLPKGHQPRQRGLPEGAGIPWLAGSGAGSAPFRFRRQTEALHPAWRSPLPRGEGEHGEQSNAVILAMMDVSGSMSTTKKYLARSFFFWMVEFLKHKYRNVEIRFIAHTSEAKLVD